MIGSKFDKNFASISSSTRWEGKTEQEIDEIEDGNLLAVLERDSFPIGEESTPRPKGDLVVTNQDAGEEWRIYRPFTSCMYFGIPGKPVLGNFCLIKKGYFEKVVEENHGSGDYCGYCGAFNGTNGEDRNGYDCCYCGSN